MRGAIFFLVLSISFVGCSGESGGEDAGSDGGRVEMDAGRDAGRADAGPRDAGAVDAGSDAGAIDAGTIADAGTDAGEASDAGSDGGSDAGAADAGRDAGSVPPGECDTTSPLCSTLCLVAVNCVRACGGPVTNCGCCPCAPGSMNVFECSGASE